MGPGVEFDVIRTLLARWGTRAIGIGDDAATMNVPRGDKLVASVDTAVEGRHFRSEWSTAEEIGYRAVVAALSDLAAMAARPLGILIAITLPLVWESRIERLADGIGSAADVGDSPILGGNLSTGSALSITTTVLGSAFAPLARSGARVGDRIYVTGSLGGPGAALQLLETGQPAGAHRERLFRPRPRIHEARWLAGRGAAAAIDISDGLVADLRHLAAASAVSIVINGERVPRVGGVELDAALVSGEEYEIVVAAPHQLDVDAFLALFGIPLTEIGRVEGRDATARDAAPLVEVVGARVANAAGHDHFLR
jgi:thiamine-monophosphate kinase